jgi:hypothetical protein
MATRDQGVRSATMKRALVVTREVNKRNGYDVFLSYHRGDAADAESWALSTCQSTSRHSQAAGLVCLLRRARDRGLREHHRAPEGRRRPFAFAARPLLADVADATRLPVRVDGRPSCGPPGGWSAPALLVVNAEAGGSRRPSGHERALVLICCDDQPTRQAVVAGAADRADVGTARGQGSLPAQQRSARPTLPGYALPAAE